MKYHFCLQTKWKRMSKENIWALTQPSTLIGFKEVEDNRMGLNTVYNFIR